MPAIQQAWIAGASDDDTTDAAPVSTRRPCLSLRDRGNGWVRAPTLAEHATCSCCDLFADVARCELRPRRAGIRSGFESVGEPFRYGFEFVIDDPGPQAFRGDRPFGEAVGGAVSEPHSRAWWRAWCEIGQSAAQVIQRSEARYAFVEQHAVVLGVPVGVADQPVRVHAEKELVCVVLVARLAEEPEYRLRRRSAVSLIFELGGETESLAQIFAMQPAHLVADGAGRRAVVAVDNDARLPVEHFKRGRRRGDTDRAHSGLAHMLVYGNGLTTAGIAMAALWFQDVRRGKRPGRQMPACAVSAECHFGLRAAERQPEFPEPRGAERVCVIAGVRDDGSQQVGDLVLCQMDQCALLSVWQCRLRVELDRSGAFQACPRAQQVKRCR